MLNQVSNSYKNPINLSGAPGIASSVKGIPSVSYLNGNILPSLSNQINSQGSITGQVQGQGNQAQAIRDAENAAYYGQTQYLDPQFAQAEEKLNNSLINQGITQGSENYNNAQLNFANQKQQAYGNAALQAVQSGQNEQNTLFGQGLNASQLQNAAQAQSFGQGLQSVGLANTNALQNYQNQLALNQQNNANQAQAYGQGLTNANLQNQAQQQYLQQQFAIRNQPLNEYNALMTGAQVQQPSFNSVPQTQVANTDVAGINNSAYQNQLAAYQQQMAGINNLFSLGGSLGSAAIFASDRRLKRDIVRIGETVSGYPVYEFSYIWDGEKGPRYRGVMADEVAPTLPEAVHYDENGFASVDYSRIK